jgi:hypothetical protein
MISDNTYGPPATLIGTDRSMKNIDEMIGIDLRTGETELRAETTPPEHGRTCGEGTGELDRQRIPRKNPKKTHGRRKRETATRVKIFLGINE